MTVVALETDETLLILKIAFLVLLYGFILLVVRTATTDIGGAMACSLPFLSSLNQKASRASR